MATQHSTANNALGLTSCNAYPPSQIQRSHSNGTGAPHRPQPSMGAPYIHPVDLPNSPQRNNNTYTGLLTPAQSPIAMSRALSSGPVHLYPNTEIIPGVLFKPGRTPSYFHDVCTLPNPNNPIFNTPFTNPPIYQSVRLQYYVYSTSSGVIPYPWCITITSAAPNQPITLSVVLTQLFQHLNFPIVSDVEFRRFNLPEQSLARKYFERRRAIQVGNTAGAVRSDFLLGCTRFMGIMKGADGGLVIVLSDVGVQKIAP